MTLDPENTVCIVKYNLDWICSSYDADCDSFQNTEIHSTMLELYMKNVRLGLGLMQKLKWLIG